MKDIFPTLYKNSTIKSNIGYDICHSSSSHAYIIEGPEGSGKKTISRLIASALACENRFDEGFSLPCGKCNNCRRIEKNISSDVVWITKEDKATIGVEAIRNIRRNLYVTPNDSYVRVYIIDSAEKMTVQAQNALLLSLEEPPSFVTFILLTSDSKKLLETVRSRAQLMRCELFGADELTELLRKNPQAAAIEKKNPSRFAAAVSLSNGSLGKAEELLLGDKESSALIRLRDTAETFINYICNGKMSETLGLIAKGFPKSNEETKQILFLCDNAIRDMFAFKKCPDAETYRLCFYTSADAIPEFAERISVKKLLRIRECICDGIVKLESNVSAKSVLTALAMKSASVRRS